MKSSAGQPQRVSDGDGRNWQQQYADRQQRYNVLFPEQQEREATLYEFADLMRTHAHERATLQEQVVQAQRDVLRTLSSSLFRIVQGVVLMPLIGAIDTTRASRILEVLLLGGEQHRAVVAIIDITGVEDVARELAHDARETSEAYRTDP